MHSFFINEKTKHQFYVFRLNKKNCQNKLPCLQMVGILCISWCHFLFAYQDLSHSSSSLVMIWLLLHSANANRVYHRIRLNLVNLVISNLHYTISRVVQGHPEPLFYGVSLYLNGWIKMYSLNTRSPS